VNINDMKNILEFMYSQDATLVFYKQV